MAYQKMVPFLGHPVYIAYIF